MNKKVKVIGIIILAYLLVISSLAYALGSLTVTVTPGSTSIADGAAGTDTITTTSVPNPTSATVTLTSTLPLWWGLLYYNKAQVTIQFNAAVNTSTSYDVIIQFINQNGEIISGGSTTVTGNNANTITADIPLDAWIPRSALANLTVELSVLPP